MSVSINSSTSGGDVIFEGGANTLTVHGNINATNLADVAYSGDYNDLLNRPSNSSGSIIESSSDGKQWYKKYSDGWIEQGGYTVQAGRGGTRVNFIVPYTNVQTVNVIAVQADTSGDDDYLGQCSVHSLTVSTFNISSCQAGTFHAYWRASGY